MGEKKNKNKIRNPVLHNKIDILNDRKYRGFTVTDCNFTWNGFEICVENPSGTKLEAKAKTKEEACEKIINLIDYTSENHLLKQP